MKENTKKESAFSLKLKGSRNIIFPASEVYEEVRRKSFSFLKSNGFKEVILSSFDYKNTFASSIGEDTDIVQKEIFTFSDKKGRNIALRPEGTACIAKMVFQEEISKNSNSEKIFYWGNMFRYERPQKGRYREFWQLGVEILNSPSNLASDCEVLYIANSLLRNLGVNDYCFYVNYLGSEKTIKSYADCLKKTFLSRSNQVLCELCQSKILLNPLRIVDCEICSNLQEIPSYSNFLSEEEVIYFDKVRKILFSMNIKFSFNEKLVRGISYYNGLVFECKVKSEKKSLLGGGRYDNLTSKRNGKKVSSIGFALGIDRLIDFCKQGRMIEVAKSRKTDFLLLLFSEDYFLPSILIKDEIQKNIGNKFAIELVIFDSTKNQKVTNVISNFKPLFSAFYGSKENETGYLSVLVHSTGKKFSLKKELLIGWIAKQLKTRD